MKIITMLMLAGVQALAVSKHHRPQRNIDLMSNQELNSALEAKRITELQVPQSLTVMRDVNSNVQRLEALVNDKEDPDWKSLALELITKLQDPVNGLLLSWNDWWLAHNALGATANWDPEHNPHHLIRSEVSDINKAMGKIRALEKKLSGKDWTGQTNFDWNLLNSLKREVGIPVEFPKDAEKKFGGPGGIPSKAVAAHM